MESPTLTHVAQYLRTSTERQFDSLHLQREAIRKFALERGFLIVKSYEDFGKSGLSLQTRNGLKSLLKDVLTGEAKFKAILVYDVSRWGRFQDNDESAHYEFICRRVGIPVYYCAESFKNDMTLPSMILKAVRRSMAAEYSRDLGEKFTRARRRVAALGYNPGGLVGFGLRRLMVSADGSSVRELATGERKYSTTDRVLIVPGPSEDCRWVRWIFAKFLEGHRFGWIARELNAQGVQNGPFPWNYHKVLRVLTNSKYCGILTWGRTSRRLGGPRIGKDPKDWTVTRLKFLPIVPPETFRRTQVAIEKLRKRPTQEQLISRLRSYFHAKGSFIITDLKTCKIPGAKGLRDKLGWKKLCKSIGCHLDIQRISNAQRGSRACKFREDIRFNILSTFGARVREECQPGRRISILSFDSGLRLVIRVCHLRRLKQGLRWTGPLCDPPIPSIATLICTTHRAASQLRKMYLVPQNTCLGVVFPPRDLQQPQIREIKSVSELGHCL